MRMRTVLLAALVLLGGLCELRGSLAAQTLEDAPRIAQQDFKKLFAARNVVVVDTRNADAYDAGHIPGALLLPLEGLPSWPAGYEKTVAELKATKKPIVTYCA
jgi:rhodanese-related sulfurtransferase